VELIRFALMKSEIHCRLSVLADGEQAFKYLDEVDAGTAECPSLFVLDLNLPKRPGTDVLARIRRSPFCKDVPVVVLSSSAATNHKEEARLLGASTYITKPSDLDAFLNIGELLKPFLPAGG
jgi:DNA-binding response OmpR family regulator